jgi:hypothetical protein
MGVPSQALPTVGQPNSTEDSKVRSCLSELQTILNGNVDPSNISSATVQTFLQLLSTGTHKIAFGKVAVPPGFGGGRQVTSTIAHGLSTTPAWAIVSGSYVGSADLTPSGSDQAVVTAITSVDATNINVTFFLPAGFTASVGAGPVWWAAIS